MVVGSFWELRVILNKKDNLDLIGVLQRCSNIEEFLDKLIILIVPLYITVILTCRKEKENNTDYSKILDEIDRIGWDKLSSVNHDFTEIKLKMYDSMNRQHILNVKLNSSVPEFSAEYPCLTNFQWHEGRTIKEIYNLFCDEAEHFQEFWKVMEELDNGCWVLEPENPSKSDTYRKISIASNVSLKVDVDPKHPRYFPSITWLGSETAVFSLREKILDRIEVWENDLPIHVNLEKLLEISLPTKQTLQADSESNEVTCCICYSERLNGQVPSRTCDNPQCGQSFHIYCLYEWLRNLIQTTRKQGNKVFGACPYCEQPISCKPPDS
uniref:EOG090X0G12 n=1 Tax=Simocephalus serrulatus TaxID=117539 RepID=A0A4Y7NPJ5_9CRUS|nr:EOG090X0G12 [Simocephalus serrulatus]